MRRHKADKADRAGDTATAPPTPSATPMITEKRNRPTLTPRRFRGLFTEAERAERIAAGSRSAAPATMNGSARTT